MFYLERTMKYLKKINQASKAINCDWNKLIALSLAKVINITFIKVFKMGSPSHVDVHTKGYK